MKLSVYLIRESVTDFDGVIQQKYLNGEDAFVELPMTASLPFECKAFIQKNKPKAPRWMSFLASHFNTGNLGLLNQSNSFILILRSKERIFAVTFGYGFQAIDLSKIEPRFGLIVCANSLNAEQIRTLETNLVDAVTRNRRTHFGAASTLSAFELNTYVDLVRKMGGKPQSNKVAKSISGADSCCIGVDCKIEEVGTTCATLLGEYESQKYKAAFPHLDNLWPLRKKSADVAGLDALLIEKLLSRSHEKISIAFCEVPDEELLEHYCVSAGSREVELEELTLAGIYNLMDVAAVGPDPSKVFIIGIGDNGPVTKRRSLRDYLVSEIDNAEGTFLFCLGHWYKANKDYVQSVRDQVAAITDFSSELDMIPLRNGEDEGAYNQRLANEKNWALMDKNNFQIGNTHDKVEVCDLLTPECHLICVKKMVRSSSLSHLFSQGSVSAALLRENADYRNVVNLAGSEAWAEPELIGENLAHVKIVYAVATEKEGPLSSTMFFFSLVNLLNHVKAISRLGCQAGICRVSYEGDPDLAAR